MYAPLAYSLTTSSTFAFQSSYYEENASTGFIQNKLNNMRLKLTPSKKKNRIVVVQRKPRKPRNQKKAKPDVLKSPKTDKKDISAKVMYHKFCPSH